MRAVVALFVCLFVTLYTLGWLESLNNTRGSDIGPPISSPRHRLFAYNDVKPRHFIVSRAASPRSASPPRGRHCAIVVAQRCIWATPGGPPQHSRGEGRAIYWRGYGAVRIGAYCGTTPSAYRSPCVCGEVRVSLEVPRTMLQCFFQS